MEPRQDAGDPEAEAQYLKGHSDFMVQALWKLIKLDIESTLEVRPLLCRQLRSSGQSCWLRVYRSLRSLGRNYGSVATAAAASTRSGSSTAPSTRAVCTLVRLLPGIAGSLAQSAV